MNKIKPNQETADHFEILIDFITCFTDIGNTTQIHYVGSSDKGGGGEGALIENTALL